MPRMKVKGSNQFLNFFALRELIKNLTKAARGINSTQLGAPIRRYGDLIRHLFVVVHSFFEILV